MGLGLAIGAASLGGSLIQAGAAGQASKQQANAANNALNLQKYMFGQAQSALSPYYTAGQGAVNTLSSLLNPGSMTSTLESLPGFQFQSQWGGLSATNALAAQGLGGSSGPLAKAISDYNQGLAGTYWGNYAGALQNFSNMGAGAASSLAGNALGFGNSMANTTMAGGAARAAGTLGTANALSSGIGGAANGLLLSSLLGNQGGGGGGIYGNLGYNLGLSNYGGMSNEQQDYLQDTGFGPLA